MLFRSAAKKCWYSTHFDTLASSLVRDVDGGYQHEMSSKMADTFENQCKTEAGKSIKYLIPASSFSSYTTLPSVGGSVCYR